MSINKSTLSGIDPLVETRDVVAMKNKTGNLYESIAVMARRANQISSSLQQDLQKRLEEFSIISDPLEEQNDNKEQIEVSKSYERLPNPAIIAINEFLEGDIYYKKKEQE